MNNKYALKPSDISAILAAFPLVPELSDSDIQRHINTELCISAAKKLSSHASDFSANEFRVITGAVLAAKEYLSGQLDIDLDQELQADLKKYLFTYNHLISVFEPMLDQFHN